MLGSVFAVLKASLTSPTPRAAASTIVRSRPVIRETSVATAIVPAARRMPRLAPGTPSGRGASSSSASPGRCPPGTGGNDVITWVSSAAGTQRARPAGGGMGGSGRAGVDGPRGTNGGTGGGGAGAGARGARTSGARTSRAGAASVSSSTVANGADGGGAAR
jgi:hypothetical protein